MISTENEVNKSLPSKEFRLINMPSKKYAYRPVAAFNITGSNSSAAVDDDDDDDDDELEPNQFTIHFKPRSSCWPLFLLITCILFLLISFLLATLIPCKTMAFMQTLFIGISTKILPVTDDDINTNAIQGTPFRVVLVGDSLINRPYNHFDLAGKIQSQSNLPHYSLEIVNCGSDGATINRIRNISIPDCVLPNQPHAVIVFYHSDVASYDETLMTSSQIVEKHIAYQTDTEAVINILQGTGARVALSSMGLLGETKSAWFQPSWQWAKNDLLNSYSEMNREIAYQHNISFLDIRSALKNAIPVTQMSYAWCVTIDGEHENIAGTEIVAQLFAKTIRGWLQERDST